MLKVTFALFLCIISTTSAYTYGVDFSAATTLDQLKCFKNANYGNVMPRVFMPNGQVDTNGIQTMTMIQKNNLGFKIIPYITPQPDVGNAAGQVDKAYNALKASNIQYDTIYIQVQTIYTPWSQDTSYNTKFIIDMCNRITSYGKTVGIYTTYGEWVQTTNNAQSLVPNVVLWYQSNYGPGVTGESQPTFDDFLNFGPFTKSMARIKQFATQETVCGVAVNRDTLL